MPKPTYLPRLTSFVLTLKPSEEWQRGEVAGLKEELTAVSEVLRRLEAATKVPFPFAGERFEEAAKALKELKALRKKRKPNGR